MAEVNIWEHSVEMARKKAESFVYVIDYPKETHSLYYWYLEEPSMLIPMTFSHHEEMLEFCENRPEYHFVKSVYGRDPEAVDEIVRICVDKWQGQVD